MRKKGEKGKKCLETTKRNKNKKREKEYPPKHDTQAMRAYIIKSQGNNSALWKSSLFP